MYLLNFLIKDNLDFFNELRNLKDGFLNITLIKVNNYFFKDDINNDFIIHELKNQGISYRVEHRV